MKRDHVLQSLSERGLLAQCSDIPKLSRLLSNPKSGNVKVYTGFDPTAPSLHVGNLLAIISLLRFLHQGHKVVALIGGATGAIGDPSGKVRVIFCFCYKLSVVSLILV
jgi:tyrosyl-tRNA synthetase